MGCLIKEVWPIFCLFIQSTTPKSEICSEERGSLHQICGRQLPIGLVAYKREVEEKLGMPS